MFAFNLVPLFYVELSSRQKPYDIETEEMFNLIIGIK